MSSAQSNTAGNTSAAANNGASNANAAQVSGASNANAAQVSGARTLYIGDVHGCADELEKIVDAFGFVRGKDTLYQTGDIINRGPDMYQAIKFVEKNGIQTVRGNHEEHLIRMMDSPQETWTDKQRTRFSLYPMEIWQYIYDVVKKWPLWRDTPHALLVHAGIEPGKNTLEEMDQELILSIREWNGRPWYEQVYWPKKIVFGHWAKKGFVNIPGFLGLDSGCVYGKKLTAWCPEEDRFYEIPAAREYSPVKDKGDTAKCTPCKILGDSLPDNHQPQKFDEIVEIIKTQRNSEENQDFLKVKAEWAGYND